MYSEFRAKFNFLPQCSAIKIIYSDRLIKGSLCPKEGWHNKSSFVFSSEMRQKYLLRSLFCSLFSTSVAIPPQLTPLAFLHFTTSASFNSDANIMTPLYLTYYSIRAFKGAIIFTVINWLCGVPKSSFLDFSLFFYILLNTLTLGVQEWTCELLEYTFGYLYFKVSSFRHC